MAKEYSFEVLKNYPPERRLTITKQMTKSVFDDIGQMIFGGRK